MVTLHHTENPAEEAGGALSKLLLMYQRSPILLLLSGGSEIDVLLHTNFKGDSSHVTITVADERCTRHNEERNYPLIETTGFIQEMKKQGAHFLSPEMNPAYSPEEIADEMEHHVKAWVSEHPNGQVIALLGIGKDGHIGGIIPPLSEEETTTERWFIAHRVPPSSNAFTSRVSVSFYFLEHIVSHTIVHISGEEKRAVYEKFIVDTLPRNTFPAHELYAMNDVHLYTEL